MDLVASWHQTPNATNVLFPTTLAKARYHQPKVVDLCPETIKNEKMLVRFGRILDIVVQFHHNQQHSIAMKEQ